MNNFFRGVGHYSLLFIERALWPAIKGLVWLFWEVVKHLTLPLAKKGGEVGATLLPYALGIVAVVGGLYALLRAPQHLQEQAIALVAFAVFCGMLWAVFKSAKKPVATPPRHQGRRRRR